METTQESPATCGASSAPGCSAPRSNHPYDKIREIICWAMWTESNGMKETSMDDAIACYRRDPCFHRKVDGVIARVLDEAERL